MNKKIANNKEVFLKLMTSFKTSLRDYVDQPSEQNLNKMISIAKEYRDDWIRFISEDPELGQIKPSKEFFGLHEALKVDGLGNESDQEEVLDSQEKLSDFGSQSKELRLDMKLYPTNKIKNAVQKDELNRVESADEKTKLLTYSIFIPSGDFDDTYETIEEQDFIQHSIRARREKESEHGKRLNRRWYFEKSEEDNENKLAWWCERKQLSDLLNRANDKEMFRKEFDDNRFSETDIKYTWSGGLNYNERESWLKEISLEHEREQLRDSNYHFCIAEIQYPKAIRQIGNEKFNKSKNLWRDILIFSEDSVTIRSTTNDRYHKPSEKITDSGWLISNDMTSIPNQVARKFATYIKTDLKINE